MIRILIAEDHQLLRDGLRALLASEPNMRIVAEAADGHSAVQLATQHGPDVILMDISLPELNGVEATRQILQERRDLRILILTMHDDAPTVDRALRAGARGFVLKGGGASTLCQAIRTVAQGGSYLDPAVTDYVLRGYLDPQSGEHDPLTPREREILQLIAEGHTSAEIGERLGVKAKTIQNARSIILEKLQERTTAGLVRAAMRLGLTPSESR